MATRRVIGQELVTVFSSKPDRAPCGRWEPARVRKGSAVDRAS